MSENESCSPLYLYTQPETYILVWHFPTNFWQKLRCIMYHLFLELPLFHFHCVASFHREVRLILFFLRLRLSKFWRFLTLDTAPSPPLETHHSPLSFPLLQFIFPLPKRGGWWSVDWVSICGVRGEGRRWEIQILICFFLSPSCSAAALALTFFYASCRTVCGCVATSKHFFHACLSSSCQLGPLTASHPARCERQTQAIFLQSKCQTAVNFGNALPQDV